MIKLPLPEPDGWAGKDWYHRPATTLSDIIFAPEQARYTADQMRDYAAAEREECAKLCDDKAKETFSGQCQTWGDYFANAIRARGTK